MVRIGILCFIALLAAGLNPVDMVDVRFTMHFPDMENMWGALTLNWKPLGL